MIKLAFIVATLFTSLTTKAFTVFSFEEGPLKFHQPTHIFIAGYGKELGHQFVLSALTRMRETKRMFPNHRMLTFWAKENGEKKDIKWLSGKGGVKLLLGNNKKISLSRISDHIEDLKNVKSFHLYSHNSPFFGAGIQKGRARISKSKAKFKHLKHIFSKDAYAILHGCNTAFLEAKKLSKTWEIPVFGSATSTDFQRLHSDGNWYTTTKGGYPNKLWAKTDINGKSCRQGSCHRLKPDIFPYRGKWGRFEASLPIYKAFCTFNTEAPLEKERCLKGIYNNVIAFPSNIQKNASNLTREKYKEVLFDYLCPIHPKNPYRQECRATLLESELVGDLPFHVSYGNAIDCNYKKCFVKVKWSWVGVLRLPQYHAIGGEKKVTIVREYLDALKAYDLVHAEPDVNTWD